MLHEVLIREKVTARISSIALSVFDFENQLIQDS